MRSLVSVAHPISGDPASANPTSGNPTSASSTDPSRRAALLDLKLRVLVREHLGRDLDGIVSRPPSSFGRGAALVVDRTAWVLVDDQPERGLGAALAWLSRQTEVTGLSLIADSATGVLARRAELFTTPITVWHAVERLLVPALGAPYPDLRPLDPAHEALRSLIVAGGADPLVEHGVLVGEVRGLEVCRAVTDGYTAEVRLEVGVGAHDREAFSMLHGARPTVEALADVVQAVEKQRMVGAALHPLNRFGSERFLRWLAIQAPQRLGLSTLWPVEPPVERANIKDAVPCAALGEALDGGSVVVVFSTGIDLDLVPFAADARAMHSPQADLVLVVPGRDVNPITEAVAATTARPTKVVGWS